MKTFYMVGIEETCDSHYFYSKENAKNFIKESYEKDFGGAIEDEIYMFDMTQLEQEDYIDDYAWIEECHFEDEE